jgi:hypothetical protein
MTTATPEAMRAYSMDVAADSLRKNARIVFMKRHPMAFRFVPIVRESWNFGDTADIPVIGRVAAPDPKPNLEATAIKFEASIGHAAGASLQF